jgi:hypothetical protein
MNRCVVLIGVVAIGLILVGCQSDQGYQIRTFVDLSSIPEQPYDVTEYRGSMSGAYAVLLEIADDGIEVVMQHTPFTEKIGLDSAGDYIDEFHTRNKGYRVLRISDENGTVRAYLVVSNLLNDQVRIAGERITVTIEDPYYGYLRSAP